jgi:sigma-B regulation protein RsbU (phosphoserine phosphatase)
MAASATLKSFLRRFGWVEKTFIAAVVLYIILLFAAPGTGWTALAQFITFLLGLWIVGRVLRVATRHAIWRLRNRLIVTYLFIGGVPILLIAALVGIAVYGLASQVSVYFVTSELDRRVDTLREAARGLAYNDNPNRLETMRRMCEYLYKDRFPGMVMLTRTPSGLLRYPPNSVIEPPRRGAGDIAGLAVLGDSFYAWAHQNFPGGDITVLAPMGTDELSRLVPNLGTAHLLRTRPAGRSSGTQLMVGNQNVVVEKPQQASVKLPPPAFRGDTPINFAALLDVVHYDNPAKTDRTFLYVSSRLSAVYDVLFTRRSDELQLVPIVLAVNAVLFLIVEIVSLVVGITMTRTITRAVHHLYEGTQRVMQGDFSHRIQVKGSNQLSDLGHSFNLMTGRIETLLDVAKEKERLQSEIEIAREVQSQLYPKKVPDIRTLRLTAVCKPARMVSGDYFDYECVSDQTVALAIGDVAGKGISAALLMATLQSSLRSELRNSAGLSVAAGNGHPASPISTASLVLRLNEQLYAYTSPEKYATFYLGIYDEGSGLLRYTNAGHLPPVLVRSGEASRLNVDGTVVGAFPFARYEESRIQLQSSDLLLCFTDGASEPENEFGEMFGEERLVELVLRNAHRSDAQIIESIIGAVEEWTGTPELQDDMTLLLARRE